MRARWVILIAGGVVVLALGALFVLPERARANVQILGQTNGTVTIRLANGTQKPHAFSAWPEFSIDDATWQRRFPGVRVSNVRPGDEETVTVRKPDGKMRIVVTCFPLNTRSWEGWRDTLITLMGFNPSRAYWLYIPVE